MQPVDDVDARDLVRAQARLSDLEELLLEAERKTREAYQERDTAVARAKDLERQLDETAAARSTRIRIAEAHAAVSKLPPALNRDRANANQLAAENAELRQLVDDLKNGRNPT